MLGFEAICVIDEHRGYATAKGTSARDAPMASCSGLSGRKRLIDWIEQKCFCLLSPLKRAIRGSWLGITDARFMPKEDAELSRGRLM